MIPVIKRKETFSALHRDATVMGSLVCYLQNLLRKQQDSCCAESSHKAKILYSLPFPAPRPIARRRWRILDERRPCLTVKNPKTSDRFLMWLWDVQLKKQETAIQDEVIIFIGHLQRHPSSNIGVSSLKLSSKSWMPTALANNLTELTLWIISGVTRSEKKRVRCHSIVRLQIWSTFQNRSRCNRGCQTFQSWIYVTK
jgi:hypothetical protein